MRSFSEQEAPSPSYGSDIPEGVRMSILLRLHDEGTGLRQVWAHLMRHEGWVSLPDAVDEIEVRWGRTAANKLRAGGRDARGIDEIAEAFMRKIPASLYLDAIHYAIDGGVTVWPQHDVVGFVNDLFERKGIHYRLAWDGEPQWHGDAGAYEHSLRPALDVLADPRLAGCAAEFGDAVAGMLAGSDQSRSRGMGQAAMAVESAMKVLLDERQLERPHPQTAHKLWEALYMNDVVPKKAECTVLAASRWGNDHRHGVGADARSAPASEAAACVMGAAAAIVYLAAVLP
jgi:hypothetical protein